MSKWDEIDEMIGTTRDEGEARATKRRLDAFAHSLAGTERHDNRAELELIAAILTRADAGNER